jgi:hypothetical protein
MAAETLDISLRADIKHLKDALASMEGIGKKEASAMVGAMTREYRKAEKAAKKLGNTTGVEITKGMDKAKGAAERTASLMGGAFGDVSDSVLDLGERVFELSGSIGGVAGAATLAGGSIGALALGMGFAANAAMEWLDTSDDLKATLEDVVGLPPLSPEHELALEAYTEASRDADAAAAQASLTLMGDLAPAMTNVQHAVIGLSDAVSSLTGETLSLSDAVSHQIRGMANAGIATAALAQGYDYLVGRGEDVADSISHITDEMKEAKEAAETWEGGTLQTAEQIRKMTDMLGYDTTPAVVDLDKRTRDAAAAAREHARALEEEWRAAQDYQKAINAATSQLDEMVRAEKEAAKVQLERSAAFDTQLQDIVKSFDGIKEEVDKAQDELLEEKLRHHAEMGMASITAISETITAFGSAELDVLSSQVAERKKLFEAGKKERQVERDKVDALLEAGEITQEQADFRMAAIDAEAAAARRQNAKTRREEEEAIIKAFKAKKVGQIAEATMQAAQNSLALLPAFAYLGAGAPAAAAGVSLAMLAAQLKVINNQSPPEFPMGGMSPDHFPIGVQPGEGILSRSGVEAAGGPEGVDLLNRNSAGMQGGTVILQIDNRTAGALVMSASKSGHLARDADRRAKTLPGIKGVR